MLAPTEVSFEEPPIPPEDESDEIDLNDFEACCKACGYPKPYPKQIEMADFIFDESDEPRILLGTRKIGKSDYCTIMKTAQVIARDKKSIVLITKEKERGREFVAEIARCLKCLGVLEFRKLTSQHIVLVDNKTKEPNLIALPSKGRGIRSRHPDFIICDDLVVPEDAESPTERKRIKKLYNELMALTKRVRLIGQPVHGKDLYQFLRKKIKKMLVPHGSIPELDENLEALRIAGVDEITIKANYLLDVDDMTATPFSKLEITNIKLNISDGTVASVDPSHEGGDTTSMTVAKHHFDKLLFVGGAWRKAWYDCLDKILEFVQKYNVKILFFENNALGDEPIRQLNKLFKDNQINCKVIGFKSLENKEAKIQNAAMFIKLLMMSDESNLEYRNQIIDYEAKIGNDDAPDSLANLLINLGLMKSAKEKQEIKKNRE